jgi:hypothetical protein
MMTWRRNRLTGKTHGARKAPTRQNRQACRVGGAVPGQDSADASHTPGCGPMGAHWAYTNVGTMRPGATLRSTELAVADRLRHIPAHTPKDDPPRKVTAFEIDHRGALRCLTDHDHIPTGLGVQLCDRTRGGVAPLVCAAARMSRPIDCPIARRKSVCRMVHIAPAPTEHDLPVRGTEAALRNPRGVAWWVRDTWDGTIQIET